MTLHLLWDRRCQVRSLSFVARSEAETGWSGRGVGAVEVRLANDTSMTFHEQGNWRPESGRETRFTNVYRWTLAGDLLRLEHRRFGADNPVYLFDLAQVGEREWRSASPYLCSEDCYAATMLILDDRIILRWTIDGPRKLVKIEYTYV